MSKYAESAGGYRKSKQIIATVLNNILPGTADENTEKLSKSRFRDESEKSYPYDELHMYPENARKVLRKQTVLNDLTGKVYSIEANKKIPDDFNYPSPLILAVQNQKKTNTGALAKSIPGN